MKGCLFALALVALPVAAEHESWAYEGEMGPEHWQELEGSACSGAKQSPVNIIRTDTDPDSQADWPLAVHYPATTPLYSVTNNGHSIQYDFAQGDEITFNGADYALKQLHFHEPSEHTLNGVRYPIEMHMVHYSAPLNRYTVLAVLGYEGTPSVGYQFLEQYLPLAKGETKKIAKPFDLSQVLPSTLTPRFHYEGSLTTPPCTENVNWVVFENPFMLSEQQVYLLKDAMPLNNYRGTQPLSGRDVSLVVH